MEWILMVWAFIQLHWLDVSAIIVLIIVAALAWRFSPSGKRLVAHKLQILVKIADDYWDSGEGKTKFADVYMALPFIIKLLWTEKEISKIVDDILDDIDKELKKKELEGTVEPIKS